MPKPLLLERNDAVIQVLFICQIFYYDTGEGWITISCGQFYWNRFKHFWKLHSKLRLHLTLLSTSISRLVFPIITSASQQNWEILHNFIVSFGLLKTDGIINFTLDWAIVSHTVLFNLNLHYWSQSLFSDKSEWESEWLLFNTNSAIFSYIMARTS